MWWSSSPLAAQMDPSAIAKLQRLWLIMAEQEYVHDQLYNVIGWDNIDLYARSPDGPDWQRVQELFDRNNEHFDEYMALIKEFQMTPLARVEADERDAKLRELFGAD
jgi:hypothetical protein